MTIAPVKLSKKLTIIPHRTYMPGLAEETKDASSFVDIPTTIGFADDRDPPFVFSLERPTWEALGQPDTITITVSAA